MSDVKRYDMRVSLGGVEPYESPCGDYVDYEDYAALEDKCAALAAENAGLNKFIKDDCWIWDDKSEEYFDAADCMPETPATDASLAEVRAQGVEMYADNLDNGADDAERGGFDDAVKFLRSEASGVRLFAAQLRKWVDQK